MNNSSENHCDRQCGDLADLFYGGMTWDNLTDEQRDAFGRHVNHMVWKPS